MNSSRLLLSVALVGLSACSLVAKIKGKSAGDVASASGASPITADAKDSPAVKNALKDLADLEAVFKEKNWNEYALQSRRLHSYFLFDDGLHGEAKRKKIMKRLGRLDADAFGMFPRLKELVGRGKRVLEADIEKSAIEPLVAVLDACSDSDDIRSKEALDTTVVAYEKAIARVKKVDPNAFRYFGSTNSRYGSKDIPSALLACEGNLAARASAFAEEYVPETVPDTEVEVGCGMATFLADGIRVGPGRFDSYTRTEGGASYPEKIDCKQLKKKNKFAGAFSSAVRDYASYIEIPGRELFIVADGKPYVEESQSDGRLHRFQKLVAYSKKFRFAKNPCGGKKVFCEAGGSKGMTAFNRMEHALARAEVHAGSNPKLCRAHLEDAKSRADWFAGFYADAKKDGSWIAGATYKTKKGQKLKEASFISKFKENGELAEEHLSDGFCDAPAAEKQARTGTRHGKRGGRARS